MKDFVLKYHSSYGKKKNHNIKRIIKRLDRNVNIK